MFYRAAFILPPKQCFTVSFHGPDIRIMSRNQVALHRPSTEEQCQQTSGWVKAGSPAEAAWFKLCSECRSPVSRCAESLPRGDGGLGEAGRQSQQLVAASPRSQHTEIKGHGADQHQWRTELVLSSYFVGTSCMYRLCTEREKHVCHR